VVHAIIRDLEPGELLPMELLLMADPSEELVSAYTSRGEVFVAQVEEEVVGVGVLIQIGSSESTGTFSFGIIQSRLWKTISRVAT
jgi:hypothetical protein